MHDAAPRPKRRRLWIVAVVGLIGMCAVWFMMPEPEEVAKAKAIRMGMSPGEVRAIMGVEPAGYTAVAGHDGVLYGKLNTAFLKLKAFWGLQGADDYDAWPVHIRFDTSGAAVDRIKRGREIVEATDPNAENSK